mmetsp:Transcript_13275/g.32410  ORF Transcript_13275/g.32410 Transcript_13275/m.32410 type:complete len:147 (-) Transcript_13275:122-562(-)
MKNRAMLYKDDRDGVIFSMVCVCVCAFLFVPHYQVLRSGLLDGSLVDLLFLFRFDFASNINNPDDNGKGWENQYTKQQLFSQCHFHPLLSILFSVGSGSFLVPSSVPFHVSLTMSSTEYFRYTTGCGEGNDAMAVIGSNEGYSNSD